MASSAAAASASVSLAFPEIAPLDEKQSGHLRHFRNLAALPPGDWTHMQGDDPDNMWDDTAYRYQLAYMTYAMALAQYHRLPAAPGFFKTDFDAAIGKMLRPECWSYWFALSQSSPQYDPSLTAPRTPWWDPVAKENIMYSGHLNAMVALYGYLFDDDKYDTVGSISFAAGIRGPWGPEKVEYSIKTLNDAIFWQMVENGFHGVACQPNRIFTICNQFPIWGFRFDDIRKGTNVADEVVAGHEKAWQDKGGYVNGTHTPFEMLQVQGDVNTWSWWGSSYFLVNSWKPEYFRSVYPMVKACSFHPNDDVSLMCYPLAQRKAALNAYMKGEPLPMIERKPGKWDRMHGMVYGYNAVTLSEAGDADLAPFLRYVDTYMNPTWEKGGLYYPRNDESWDEAGHFTNVAPHAGNVMYGWSRLNVKDGLNTLYAKPWSRDHYAEPNIAEISRDVDVVRAVFLKPANALVATLRPYRGLDKAVTRMTIANMKRQGQAWTLTVNGQNIASGTAEGVGANPAEGVVWQDGQLSLAMDVNGLTDIVIRWT